MVVSSFGRGDVNVVTPSLRHLSSLLQRSLRGLPTMQDFAVLALRLYRESHFLLFLVLFVLLHDFGLSPEGLGQSFHLIGHKRVSRGCRYPFSGDCLLPD